MAIYVIKHTTEDKFIQMKAHSPYWTDDIFKAAAYDSEVDAQIEMKRYGIPHCTAVTRKQYTGTNVASDFYTSRVEPYLDRG